jgi:beta-mannosidase
MFACSAYPTFDDDFIENVRQEAIYNVKRLHHRACLALWCGNNELEQGLVGDKWSDSTMSWEDYGRLFDKLLPSIVKQFCPNCDYWCASPHTPYGDRYDFNNPNCGDAHLWGVWHCGEPFEWYRSCEHRFNSEFGFQSFPSPETVKSYTLEKDRNITSWIMEYHQRSPIGNKTIIRYMLDWFKMPLGFENTLWLSQIQQGMVIKYACEHWRRSMPRGMGTLYWQLNDTWQVASWSSIDYFGRWKALQYMARNFFAPLLISGLESVENSTFEVHITNDLLADTQAVARWKATDAKGRQLLCGQKQIAVPKCSNVLAETVELKDAINQKSVRDVIVWLELEVGGEIVSENMVLFARPKHLELAEDVHITADVEKISACIFNVVISADKPALWVRLELDGIDAKYSDNFFNICSGVFKRVEVELAEDISAADFKKKLSVSSLINTY